MKVAYQVVYVGYTSTHEEVILTTYSLKEAQKTAARVNGAAAIPYAWVEEVSLPETD